MNWQRDKAWADRFLPEIKEVVRRMAGHIIDVRLGSDEEDTKQATDYVVEVSSGAIACRIRRNTKFRDLTIRASRPSGVTTELAKLRDGWGRWYLYMWERGGAIEDWVFVDLDLVRASGLFDSGKCIRNGDGTTFLPIPVKELATAKCIVGQHE